MCLCSSWTLIKLECCEFCVWVFWVMQNHTLWTGDVSVCRNVRVSRATCCSHATVLHMSLHHMVSAAAVHKPQQRADGYQDKLQATQKCALYYTTTHCRPESTVRPCHLNSWGFLTPSADCKTAMLHSVFIHCLEFLYCRVFKCRHWIIHE